MEEDAQISPFFSLPEACIANILSLTSPRDTCRAAAVSLGFKSAAESDTIWERFLPRYYDEMISQSDSPVIYSTKKDLYFLLCDTGLLLDGGKLSFRLSKSSGKKCYMLGARKLQIAWIHEPNYWTWTSLSESRFGEVAELKHVWWLDIQGKLASDYLSPNTSYTAYLVFKLADDHEGLVGCPLKTMIKCVGESIIENEGENCRIAYIVPPGDIHTTERGAHVSRSRIDGWMEIELGEFFVTVSRSRTDGWMEIELGELFVTGQDRFDVVSSLFQRGGPAKKGLIVEGIEVRPKSNSNPKSGDGN